MNNEPLVDPTGLQNGDVLTVQTVNTTYTISVDDNGKLFIEGNRKYCPTPRGVRFVKTDLRVGERMFFYLDEHPKPVLTSPVCEMSGALPGSLKLSAVRPSDETIALSYQL